MCRSAGPKHWGIMIKLPRAVIGVLRRLTFKGKSRLLSPFVPNCGEVEALVFGYRVALDLSDYIQREMYLGTYERRGTGSARRVLARGNTVIDVGANAGHYTLLAARCVGRTGRVLAIEPSPWVADRLERSIETNGLN